MHGEIEYAQKVFVENIYSIYNKKHVHSVWRLKSIWINDDFFAIFLLKIAEKFPQDKWIAH